MPHNDKLATCAFVVGQWQLEGHKARSVHGAVPMPALKRKQASRMSLLPACLVPSQALSNRSTPESGQFWVELMLSSGDPFATSHPCAALCRQSWHWMWQPLDQISGLTLPQAQGLGGNKFWGFFSGAQSGRWWGFLACASTHGAPGRSKQEREAIRYTRGGEPSMPGASNHLLACNMKVGWGMLCKHLLLRQRATLHRLASPLDLHSRSENKKLTRPQAGQRQRQTLQRRGRARK
jgi:hypothetical protein